MIPTDDIVQRYDLTFKTLMKSQKDKMKKFVEANCIEDLGADRWVVHHLEGYNTNNYIVTFKGNWECDCQFCQLQHSDCSHIGSVKLWLLQKANKI